MTEYTPGGAFKVLSPWADVDSKPLRGISPRLTSLNGKKVGLFRNFKQAAKPLAEVLYVKILERFPDAEVIRYDAEGANVRELETENKEWFEEWKGKIDAGIFFLGN